MTLLVLDLRPPSLAAIHSERDLWTALIALSPRIVTWLMSLLTLGIFWVGQQTHHDRLSHSDRAYSWIQIVFLMTVTMIPFSTALLAEFIQYRTALLVYWFNIFMIGLTLYASMYRARHFGLIRKDASVEGGRALLRRIYIGQSLYAIGAALCAINTYWSIGLNYAIGPRFRPFSWL